MILLIIILIIKWNSCFLFIIKWINAQMSCSVSRSCPTLATSWNAVHQASLSFTISQSLPKFMFIASVMPSSHLILWLPLLLCPQFSPASGIFQCVIFLHQITKTLKFQLQHKSFQWVVRVDLPQDWLVWSPSCPRDFQESSPMPQFEGISALVFCLLYAPAPTTIYDHWENCRLDYMDLCRQSNVSAFQHIV